jgi:hypothetical protein
MSRQSTFGEGTDEDDEAVAEDAETPEADKELLSIYPGRHGSLARRPFLTCRARGAVAGPLSCGATPRP